MRTRILLVEPDSIQAAAIRQYLQAGDIEVDVASTAQLAIASADRHRPDVVILELALPSHNGIEFLHEFRSYHEWVQIPVLIFSQQNIDRKTPFVTLGNIKYLYKPQTSLAELNKQLLELIA